MASSLTPTAISHCMASIACQCNIVLYTFHSICVYLCDVRMHVCERGNLKRMCEQYNVLWQSVTIMHVLKVLVYTAACNISCVALGTNKYVLLTWLTMHAVSIRKYCVRGIVLCTSHLIMRHLLAFNSFWGILLSTSELSCHLLKCRLIYNYTMLKQ